MEWYTHALPVITQDERGGSGFESWDGEADPFGGGFGEDREGDPFKAESESFKPSQPEQQPTVIQERTIIADLSVKLCRGFKSGLMFEAGAETHDFQEKDAIELVFQGTSYIATGGDYGEGYPPTFSLDIEDDDERKRVQQAIGETYELPVYRNIRPGREEVFTDNDFCWTYRWGNSYRRFPMAVKSAFLRVDTDDPNRWWLEVKTLGGLQWGTNITGEFTDFLHLWAYGEAHFLNQQGSDQDLRIKIPVNLQEGRQILEGFRKLHPNLPENAIVDKTRGETLSENLPRFRKSYFDQFEKIWKHNAQNSYVINFDELMELKDKFRYYSDWDGWRQNLNALYLGTMATCRDGIGMSVNVPERFYEQFVSSGASKVFDEMKVPDGTTFYEAIDGKLPEGWMYFPLSPRWIAIIPEKSMVNDQ